jgi:hypothetical protein
MTDTPNPEVQEEVQAEAPPEQPQLSQDQWNEFLGNLAQQNNALQSQIATMNSNQLQQQIAQREAEIKEMPDKERADTLERELNQIRQAGAAAQAQDISNSVWRRRDADAAARLLQLHGYNGTEPELYRGEWDVNWMPRFVASVEYMVKTKGQRTNTRAASNPANRANVGTSTSSALPELDPNASGFDTIRFALARGKT